MKIHVDEFLKTAKEYSYLPKWFLEARFLGKKKPLQTVIFITDYCNLTCKHCAENSHACTTMKSYEQIKEELTYSYDAGSRFVDFEGGEPILWRDRAYRINDLLYLAKKIGFLSTTITTNAQLPFENLEADSIWASLDGYREYHDEIRGEGTFAKLEKNIATSGHPDVSVNMVVNKRNYKSVLDVIRYAAANPHIKKVSINFHTPYPGTEHMVLDWGTRGKVIDTVIAMKRKGYPIMNSTSGLRMMKKKEFSKQCWISNFILLDGKRLPTCPGKNYGICDACGFSMAGEMHSLWNLMPDTILSGINLRMSAGEL